MTTLSHKAAIDYCRQARRLRGLYCDDVSRLHMALRQLARTPALPVKEVASDPATASVIVRRRMQAQPTTDHLAHGLSSGMSPAHQPAVHSFVQRVRDVVATVDGAQILTYSQRQQLLGQAEGLSISRFHANLVIAAVLHESAAKVVNATNAGIPAQPEGGSSALIVTMAVVQTAIIAGALSVWWWVGLS